MDVVQAAEAEAGSPQTRVYRRRWVILLLFVCALMLNAVPWMQYVVLADVVTKYYNVSYETVEWTSLVYNVTSMVLIVPTAFILDKYGLRPCMFTGTMLTAAGLWLRVLGCWPDHWWAVLTGHAVVFTASNFLASAPPRVAAVWFPASEVSTALGLSMVGSIGGVTLGCFLAPLTARANWTQEENFKGFLALNMGLAIGATLLFVAVVFLFKQAPPLPPSPAQAAAAVAASSGNYFKSVRSIIKKPSFLLLLVSFNLIVSVFVAITTVINRDITEFFPDRAAETGYLATLKYLTGMGSTMVFGVILDRTKKFKRLSHSLGHVRSVSLLVQHCAAARETRSDQPGYQLHHRRDEVQRYKMTDERVLSFPNAKSAAEYALLTTSRQLQTQEDPPRSERGSVWSRLGTRTEAAGAGDPQTLPYPTFNGVALMGDSIMVRLARSIGVHVPPGSPFCRSGLTTSSLSRALAQNTIALPARVFIILGANDALQRINSITFKRNVEQIIKDLRKSDNVTWVSLLPSLREGEKVKELNQVLRIYAGEKRMKFIEAHHRFMSKGNINLSLFERELSVITYFGGVVSVVMYSVCIATSPMEVLYVATGIMGIFMSSYFVPAYEYAVELTYPEAEGNPTSVLNWTVQPVSLTCTLVYSRIFSSYGPHVAHGFLVALMVVGFVCLLFIPRDYRRLEAELALAKDAGADKPLMKHAMS